MSRRSALSPWRGDAGDIGAAPAADEIERLRNGLEMLLVHDDWERPPEPDLVEAVKNILSRK